MIVHVPSSVFLPETSRLQHSAAAEVPPAMSSASVTSRLMSRSRCSCSASDLPASRSTHPTGFDAALSICLERQKLTEGRDTCTCNRLNNRLRNTTAADEPSGSCFLRSFSCCSCVSRRDSLARSASAHCSRACSLVCINLTRNARSCRCFSRSFVKTAF